MDLPPHRRRHCLLVRRDPRAPAAPSPLSGLHQGLGLALLALSLSGCSTNLGPTPEELGTALQHDVHRSQLTVKGLGRFGIYAPFEEDMTVPPCDPPLSDANRVCTVHLIGRGLVKIRVADAALYGGANVRKDAVVGVEYPADCENEKFDFKTMDNVLPRKGNAAGVQVWEDRLILVTHERHGEGKDARCSVVVASSPSFLKRLAVPTGIKFKGDPFAAP